MKILRITLPPTLAKHHNNVEISLDFFIVNGSLFLHTKSRKFYFRSVQACINRGKYEIISGLNFFKTKYPARVFTITD